MVLLPEQPGVHQLVLSKDAALVLQMPRSASFKRRELKRLIRQNYAHGAAASGEELDRLLDLVRRAQRCTRWPLSVYPNAQLRGVALTAALDGAQALAAVRVMKEQLQLQRCSSVATTHGCRVECTTAFSGAPTPDVRPPASRPAHSASGGQAAGDF